MKKFVSILLAVISLYGVSTAQNINDIVYLNSPIQLGTPRFVATAGAFTALGNDFSAVHLNPASIAVFRHNEFGISMGANSKTVSSTYYGTSQQQDWTNFLFANVGYTARFKTDDPDVFWNLGITYNRNSDFGYETESFGINPESTIIEDWMFFANGINPENLIDNGLIYEGLAWESFLIESDQNFDYFTEAVLDVTEQFWAERVTGRFDELGISFGIDQDNKLYYGGSINIPFYRYDSEYYYEESGYGGDSISGMAWRENFSNRGVGFNAKIGVIYKPIRNLRVGASIFTPTFMGISQTYSTEVTANFRNSPSFTARYEAAEFDYSIRNAPQANLGAAYIFNKNGFLSVDYTFLPTKWSGTNTNDLNYLNQDIDDFLQNQHMLKFGAEIRLVSIYLRGGYSWLSNPYNLVGQNAARNMFSFGIGYRSNKFNLDLAYAIQNEDKLYYPYSAEIVQPATQSITRKPFVVSASFRL